MPRPKLFEQPMTPAERKRRSRELRKLRGADDVSPFAPEGMSRDEYLASLTVEQRATFSVESARSIYYFQTIVRHGVADWLDVLGSAKRGRTCREPHKVGLRWAAGVCRRHSKHSPHGPSVQRVLLTLIKVRGTEYAQLWLKLVEEDETFFERYGIKIPDWMLLQLGKKHLIELDVRSASTQQRRSKLT